MFERFTAAAREVPVRAQAEARQLGHGHIGTEHLLLALLSPTAGLAYQVLHEAGVDETRARADVVRCIRTSGASLGDEDAEALRTIGIDLDEVLARAEASLGPSAPTPPAPARRRGLLRLRRRRHLRFTPRAKKVLELSLREALALRHGYIGPEHILLGLLHERRGAGCYVLVQAGVSLEDLRGATLRALRSAA